MGFSIPKLEIPKLPEVDINSAISSLTEAYNPSSAVGAVEGNVMSQLDSIESVRSQLENARQQAQKQSAQLDFQALSDYTAGIQQMTDVSCIMSSAKPSFTPMTPDSLSNPLAQGGDGFGLDGLASEAIGSYLGVDPAIVDAAMSGDVDTLTSPDTLSDLAIAGAGTYVSGMTGGVIPPQMASGMIKSVAGDAVKSTISSTMSGDIPNMGSLPVSDVSGTPSLDIAKSAIGADSSGNLLGAVLNQSSNGVINTISDKALSSVSEIDLTNIAKSTISSVGASRYGTNMGGFNLSDPSSLVTSEAVGVLKRSSNDGNIYAMSNMLDLLDKKGYSSDMFESIVKDIGPNLKVNPETSQMYSDIYDKYVKKEDKNINLGDIKAQVTNLTNVSYDVASTKLGEKIMGKDNARKTKALLDIVDSRRSAPKRSFI